MTLTFPVLYRDDHLEIVDKPAGVAVTDGRDARAADPVIARLGLLLCHRLDVGTSGVLVLARTPHGQRVVSDAFSRGAVRKTYLALVAGTPPDSGLIDLPLGEWKRGRVQIGRGRPARTRYTVVERKGARARLLLWPETGRTHQLRAHLSSIGAPIVGDEDYGGPAASRVYLHASQVALPWPDRGETVVDAPEPSGFTL